MQIVRAHEVAKVYSRRGAYATHAIRGVSLNVAEGEFIGIMGPSGSGKTTLLNLLSGLDRPTSGSIEVSGADISAMSDSERGVFMRRRLGFVFQEFNLLDSLTVSDNILLPMILDKREAAQMEARSRDLMESFAIADVAQKFPYEISGGQQQRAAVARAVANDPMVVFADEPTGSLDSKSSSAVMECFARLNTRSCTIIMVTHDPTAASYCSRVVLLKDGLVSNELLRDGTQREFLKRIVQGSTESVVE
jgi:putative ABC transport system ATP-binding protein